LTAATAKPTTAPPGPSSNGGGCSDSLRVEKCDSGHQASLYAIFNMHKGGPMSLEVWIDQLQKEGRYSFERTEALRELGLSRPSLKKALQRASTRRRILALRRDFYVIVPLEYSAVGAPPTEWFIDDLMRFVGRPYYVGCLSAAVWHGAAHQSPRTQTGDAPISTPEWTAFDLIRFQRHVGGMDTVATVLTELAEVLDAERLAAAAAHEPTSAYLQRLGWMLDFLGYEKITVPLHECVLRRSPSFTPLNASLENRNGDRDSRWYVIVNEEPEADL